MDRKRLTIAMLEPGGWGGICHYAYNLCQALSGYGHRVTLVSGTPYELARFPRGFRLRSCIPADAPYFRKLRRFMRCVRSAQPDLVHIQGTFSARRDWLILLLLRALGYPVVFTAHNILPHDARERNAFGMRRAFGLIYALSDRIIVHGETPRRELRERFAVPSRKISVIPHGDYTFADMGAGMDAASAKRWLGAAPEQRVVLAFGALREYKGIPDLIDAFAEVAVAVADVRLAIVGKPLRIDPEAIRSRIRRLALDDRVIFRPQYVPIEDIGRYFQAADIAVYPYRAIAQSGSLQLAYAFAKPVIVTRVGALPDTVEDGRNGLVVPPEAPRALADALIRLLTMPSDHLSEMGRRSRELAETHYRWEAITGKTTALYAALRPGWRG